MRDWLNWKLSFHRNANFWDWIRDTYSRDGLRRLVTEATDESLIRVENPFSNERQPNELVLRRTVSRLMSRYGEDIWHICLGAGGQGNDGGPSGLACLANLDGAFQVHDPATFDEFLVRNALKYGATQLLRNA
jgi:hypothetical protein